MEPSAAVPTRGPGTSRTYGLRPPGEYTSQWKAFESIAAKLSINHETLRIWVRRAETEAGQRPGSRLEDEAS
jgi:hypothetical protein